MVKRRERGTGSVRPDPTRAGSWLGTVQLDGKRYAARGRTKTDVVAKLAHIKADALTGSGKGTSDRRITVAAVVDQFLKRDLPNRRSNGRPLAPGTLLNYRVNASTLRAQLGTVRLASLTVKNVEDMYDRLACRNVQPMNVATLRKLHSMFALIITSAERRGDVNRNVVKLANVTPTARLSEQRSALAPAHARALLAALRNERNGALFACGLLLGLRPGEAAGLYWTDIAIEVEPCTVNITRAVRLNEHRAEVADDLKTTASKRTIGLPSTLAEWLRDHRQAQRVERVASRVWHDDRLVFTTPTGAVVDPKKARTDLAAICRAAGLPITRPNELRHSCASLLADEGVPNETIADLLGHTTTRMVDTTYRHRLRPVVDVAANATWATQ
ncbi:site-specific integrase [soil metagenome]